MTSSKQVLSLFSIQKSIKIRGRDIEIIDSLDIDKKNHRLTMLFIPGAGGCTKNWRYQLTYFFEKGYRVISYNPVSHGNSQFDRNYSFNEHYLDFKAIVETLGLKKDLILITHSSSTQVALYYMREKPVNLCKTVLISASLYDNDGLFWKFFLSLPSFINVPAYNLITRFWKESVIKKLFFYKGTSLSTVKDFLENNGIPRIESLLIFRTYWNFDASKWANEITVPVLVIAGENDCMVPLSKNRVLAEHIPISQLQVITNAGHLCYYEKPLEVNSIIDNFICKQR